MSKLLHITASIRGDKSISRTLSQKLVQKLSADTDFQIIERDLSKNDLPYVSESRFSANSTPKNERTQEQKELSVIADTLIEELQAADIIVLGIPVYNFGVPAVFKAWADLVARTGTTFKYTETGPVGLLQGKKAYLVLVSGGMPIGGDIDFMSPWVKFFLGFLGIKDVEMITADGIMGQDGEEKIQKAHETIDNLAA
ncbi:FMN-dependent NADH-azoreductase [Kordiimonas pumila]|uniref:FMN dependent NADH:quinone oxidoreductase n=1 Tax=Kordiimonas pumila TaxID=2161677 RepID=A0ABV7D4P1_9PROT|nr:NAD(P)H-dependent oxidoreductase [Kordiimonas pumila]